MRGPIMGPCCSLVSVTLVVLCCPSYLAEYETCTGVISWIKDGQCNYVNNIPECDYDGGDCCECTCVDDLDFPCGYNGFICVDPFCPQSLMYQYPNCTGELYWIGDGYCDDSTNNPDCGYDEGDCCGCTCNDDFSDSCRYDDFDCRDPDAGDLIHDCKETPPDFHACATAGQREWVVENAAQAQALAEGVNCSGGMFDVEWRGTVAVDKTIYVVDGTILTVTGVGADAGMDGGAAVRFFTVINASLHVRDMHFNNGSSLVGGAIAGSASFMTFKGTTFTSNYAVRTGGAMYIVAASTASWNGGTTFSRNHASWGGAVTVASASSASWSGDLQFECNFANYSGGLYVDSDSNVSWDGLVSFGNNSAITSGGAIGIYSRSIVSWNGTVSFANNSAGESGGALLVEESFIFWNGYASFFNNNANDGGAMFVGWECFVQWKGLTEFMFNKAGFDGGAVSFEFATDVLYRSSLSTSGTTRFIGNTCGGNGGGMAINGYVFVSFAQRGVTFYGNSAKFSGGAIFISSAGFGPKFVGMTFSSNSAQLGGGVYATVSGTTLTGVEHGVGVPNPTIFDRCEFIANIATATGGAIESAAGVDAIINTTFRENRAELGGALRLSGTASVENCSFIENISKEGGGAAVSNIGVISDMSTCSFLGNAFDCEPETFLYFNATFVDFNTLGGPYTTICSGCPEQCEDCHFEDPPLVPVCRAEIEHTTSAGGNLTLEQLLIDPGYWRATNTSTTVMACYHADACIGGVTGTAGFCREGYKGPYCAVCTEGYSASLGSVCIKCPSSEGVTVAAAAVSVLTVGFLVTFLWYMVAVKPEGARQTVIGRICGHLPFASLKIVIVAWQIITQFSSVANVTYPHVYQSFLDVVDVLNFNMSWVVSNWCVFNAFDFHDQLLFATIGPLIVIALLGATYAIATKTHGDSTLAVIRHKHVSMVLLVSFLVYSSVSSTVFRMFACEELDDGKTYLRSDYRIECDSKKHMALQIYAGFMIILYPVGIPLLYAALLYGDRDLLRNKRERERSWRVKLTTTLWTQYKPDRYFYELVECGRRILLSGVVVFIYPNTTAQIAITLVISVFVIVLSEGLAPFVSRWDVWISRTGHVVVFMSMYVALLLKVDVSRERASSQKVFEGMLVTGHAAMVVALVLEGVIMACSLRSQQLEESDTERVFLTQQAGSTVVEQAPSWDEEKKDWEEKRH